LKVNNRIVGTVVTQACSDISNGCTVIDFNFQNVFDPDRFIDGCINDEGHERRWNNTLSQLSGLGYCFWSDSNKIYEKGGIGVCK